MEETRFNGPEMNVRKIVVLLLTATLILVLFLTRDRYQSPEEETAEETVPVPEQFVYISPHDHLYRRQRIHCMVGRFHLNTGHKKRGARTCLFHLFEHRSRKGL